MRTEGASIVDIAKTLGISVGRVHGAIVADIKKDPPPQSTGTAGSTNPEGSVTDGSAKATVPDASMTEQPNGGK